MLTFLSAFEMNEKEKSKFEMLYNKYRNLLYIYAKNIVGNCADAEDILQDVFIKVVRNIKNIKNVEEKEALSFLIVITKNTAYDFLRKQSYYNEIPLENILEFGSDDKTIENLVEKLQYQKIVSIIKDIPSPYVEVLYFHFVNDFSIKHTAHLLGRKSQTVKTQLVRGKKILIKKLSEAIYD